jgi:hypothetical protein
MKTKPKNINKIKILIKAQNLKQLKFHKKKKERKKEKKKEVPLLSD